MLRIRKHISLLVVVTLVLALGLSVSFFNTEVKAATKTYMASVDWNAGNHAQGFNGWYYQSNPINDPNTYSDLSLYYGIGNDGMWYKDANDFNTSVAGYWQHANTSNSVRTWVVASNVPATGSNISITATAVLNDPNSTNTDGVKISIIKYSSSTNTYSTIRSAVILNKTTKSRNTNYSNISVGPNDRIHFIVNKNASFRADEWIIWDPTIALTTSTAVPTPVPSFTVYQWRMGEMAFTAQQSYSNPYQNVVADVTFTKGTTSIKRPLFWDGGNTWKVRFAPTEIGTWNWSITDSNVNDNGLKYKWGTINSNTPPADALPIYKNGFLKIFSDPNSPVNKRYLTYADGTPFFWASYTYNLVSCNNRWTNDKPGADPNIGQFQITVDKIASDGYNIVKTGDEIVWNMGIGPDGMPNATIWPIGDPKCYNNLTDADIQLLKDEMDFRMQYIADRGLINNFSVCYADYIYCDEGHKMYPPQPDGIIEDRVNDYKKWYRYLYGRYGAFPTIFSPGAEVPWYVWSNEGFIKSIREQKYTELYNYCHALVGGYQLLGGLMATSYPVSRADGSTGDETYNRWLVDLPSYDVVVPMQLLTKNIGKDQVYGDDFDLTIEDYYNRQQKPLVVNEHTWEGSTNPDLIVPPAQRVEADSMRLNIWKSAQVGCGINYSHTAVCFDMMEGMKWYVGLDAPGQYIARKVINFYTDENLPWWNLKPKFLSCYATWTNPNTATRPSQRPCIKSDYDWQQGQNEDNIVIYFPDYAKGSFDVVSEGTLHIVWGEYNGYWFNPNVEPFGAYQSCGTFTADENGNIVLPSKPDNNDWVLWLTRGLGPASP